MILICAVAVGALLGHTIGPKAEKLKPLGDVFLNLLFTAVVPVWSQKSSEYSHIAM